MTIEELIKEIRHFYWIEEDTIVNRMKEISEELSQNDIVTVVDQIHEKYIRNDEFLLANKDMAANQMLKHQSKNVAELCDSNIKRLAIKMLKQRVEIILGEKYGSGVTDDNLINFMFDVEDVSFISFDLPEDNIVGHEYCTGIFFELNDLFKNYFLNQKDKQ